MTIETWFKKGARFKWTAPSPVTPVQDGTIVASPATASNMIFDAADGRVITTVDTVGWLGFNRNAVVPHNWLCYILGRTAYTPLNVDVLTGFMSGCLIVQYTEAGQRYVAHVGTVETAGKTVPPNSTVKATFLAKLNGLTAGEKMQVKGYSPANAWDYSEILPLQTLFTNGDSKVLSLTTTGGQFFSILMIRAMREPNVWVSCGIKPVPGMGINMLTTALS